jgi:hypothetical protein
MNHAEQSINRTAASATLHCLTGCAIGEVAGMVVTTAANASNAANIVLSITLAFVFGYSFSLRPLIKHGLGWRKSLRLALASDTASITTMEAADTVFIILVPGAINATLSTSLFWVSLLLSLAVAFAAAFPVNRFLIGRGKGHALVHHQGH